MAEEKTIRIGIVGGGAAGLFTACRLKMLSHGKNIDVTILEKNSVPGKKLTLTGHGRCNITNRKDASVLKNCYHDAGNFIYPALKEFGPEETIAFMEETIGLKLKEEDNNRMFPVCDSAVKVRDELLGFLKANTAVLCDTEVKSIRKDDVFEVLTTKGNYSFDYLVLSCGGSSFPKTGSAGDSYKIAESFGHKIAPIRGALAPVKADAVSSDLTSSLSGVSLDAKASLVISGKTEASVRGEVLFADFGLTGPAVMELSREIPPDIEGLDVSIELDLVPSLRDEDFEKELIDLINDHPDTKISNLLARFIPSSVASALADRTGITGLYAHGFTKENRKKICNELKHLKIGTDSPVDLEKAYVTRGGVALKEVDRKTMQSKIIDGLYIIGEALDIDGISGGYNLQACMSEANLAANSILKQI